LLRAVQTAEPLAELLDLPIIKLPLFAKETSAFWKV
jgi:broad specificity phosphatase PhoE